MVDTILKMLDIYKESLKNWKMSVVSNMQVNVLEICVIDMHNVSTRVLHTEQSGP